MADPDSPTGRRLLVGPTGSGKTRRTAGMLEEWVRAHGADGVVVLEFAPEFTRGDGQVLGRRLERFVDIPDEVLYLLVETRAPRAATQDLDQALEIAKENATACAAVFQALPERIAVLFVNDATMAYHVPGSDPTVMVESITNAKVAVVNALDPQAFDPEHPITRQEQKVLDRISGIVDRVERLRTNQPVAGGRA